MCKRKLTRHDLGRKKFVSEVSSNTSQYQCPCQGKKYTLFIILMSLCCFVYSHTDTHILMFPLYCAKRFGIGKTSKVAPFYNSYVAWVPSDTRTLSPLLYQLWIKHTILNQFFFFFMSDSVMNLSFFFLLPPLSE